MVLVLPSIGNQHLFYFYRPLCAQASVLSLDLWEIWTYVYYFGKLFNQYDRYLFGCVSLLTTL